MLAGISGGQRSGAVALSVALCAQYDMPAARVSADGASPGTLLGDKVSCCYLQPAACGSNITATYPRGAPTGVGDEEGFLQLEHGG